MKAISFIVLGFLVITIALITVNSNRSNENTSTPTQSDATEGLKLIEDAIRERHASYTQSFENYDVTTSYSHLTPFSQKEKTLAEWEKKVLSTSKKTKRETINAIILHDDNTRAVIGVEQYGNKNASVGGYTQTWKLIEGEWYRAFSEDHTSNSDTVVSDNEPTTEVVMLNLPFAIEDFKYTWKLDRSDFIRAKLYRPEVTLRIRNTGDNQIKYLKLQVQFVNVYEDTIFSSEYEYVVTSSDIPLRPDSISEKIFFKSTIGLDIRSKLNLVSMNRNLSTQYLERLATFTNDINAMLYYKAEHSDDWVKIDEFEYNY